MQEKKLLFSWVVEDRYTLLCL